VGYLFHFARSSLNVPQFTQRLEAALTSGNSAQFEQISRERREAEAGLFVECRRYEATYHLLVKGIEQFAPIIQEAADAIDDFSSTDGLKAMSNCHGAWHWLTEMRYREQAYWHHKPLELLKELDFDEEAYLAMAMRPFV
jgi:hypothetical protein